MFNLLFKGILSFVAVKLLTNYRHLSIRLLKIEAAKSYLHGIRMARLATLSLLRAEIEMGLIGIGILLFHAGLFILLPWTVKAKAILGIFLGLSYVTIGCVAIYASLSEKTWIEQSGAAAMLKEAAGSINKPEAR